MQNNKKHPSALLNSKRFLPLFVTQFLSAINDNVYKQSVLILLVFQAATLADGALYSNIAAGLFILPFFYFLVWQGNLPKKQKNQSLLGL